MTFKKDGIVAYDHLDLKKLLTEMKAAGSGGEIFVATHSSPTNPDWQTYERQYDRWFEERGRVVLKGSTMAEHGGAGRDLTGLDNASY